MPDRADAHIHLFDGGYRGSLAGRPGVMIDDPRLYDSFAREHHVRAALVVGYEAEPWAAGNNDYIAALVQKYEWVKPLAYVDPSRPPDPVYLRRSRFGGASFYIFDDMAVNRLLAIPSGFWKDV